MRWLGLGPFPGWLRSVNMARSGCMYSVNGHYLAPPMPRQGKVWGVRARESLTPKRNPSFPPKILCLMGVGVLAIGRGGERDKGCGDYCFFREGDV